MFKYLIFMVGLVFFTQTVVAQNEEWQKLARMGRTFYENGEFESAFNAFSKARELAPEDANLDAFIAQSAYRAGKFQEAAEAYKRSSEQNSDTWTNYNKGNARFRNQDMSGAIESYKEALRKDPNNELARHNLAQALKKQENDDNQDDQNQDNQDNQDNQNQQNQNDQNQQNQDKQQNQNQDNQDNQNKEQQQEQPKMGREQTDQLLESMMQADKKAQDKLKDKEEAVGSGKREKDW